CTGWRRIAARVIVTYQEPPDWDARLKRAGLRHNVKDRLRIEDALIERADVDNLRVDDLAVIIEHDRLEALKERRSMGQRVHGQVARALDDRTDNVERLD